MKTVRVALLCLGLGAGLSTVAVPTAYAQTVILRSDDDLRAALAGLGLAPTKTSDGYEIIVKSGGATVYARLIMSQDRSKLGISSSVGAIDNAAAVPAATWLGLMEANRDIWPSFFYFDKDIKQLTMSRAVDTAGLTAANLRLQIDRFGADVINSAPLWRFTK